MFCASGDGQRSTVVPPFLKNPDYAPGMRHAGGSVFRATSVAWFHRLADRHVAHEL